MTTKYNIFNDLIVIIWRIIIYYMIEYGMIWNSYNYYYIISME